MNSLGFLYVYLKSFDAMDYCNGTFTERADMEHFTQIFSDFAGGDVSVRVYEDIESGKTYDNFFVVLGKFITL